MKYKNIVTYSILCLLTIVISFVYYIRGVYCFRFTSAVSVVLYVVLICMFLCLTLKYRKDNSRPQKVSSALLAAFLGFSTSVGKNYFEAYSWEHCFGSIRSLALVCGQTLVYGVVFYLVLLTIFAWIDRNVTDKEPENFDFKKCYWQMIGVKALYLIPFFPCLFDFDAALGLRTFLDVDSAICDHHPVFIQFVHSLFFRLGDALCCRTLGFALLAVIFIFASTSIVIYGLKLMVKAGSSQKCVSRLSCFITYFPLFPYLSLLVTKDGFFIQALFLYVLTLLELFQTKGESLKSKRFIAIHSLSILLVCLTRHQGIYIVLIEIIYLLIYYAGNRLRILSVTIPATVIALLVTKVLYPYCDVEPGGKQELYGTFFHQTAYYLTLYPEDVTPEETAAINAILDKDKLIDRYESYTTDYDKNDYKYNPRLVNKGTRLRTFHHIDHSAEAEDLRNYMRAWASMGLRHPKCYVLATASIFMGYLYNKGKPLIDIYTTGVDHPAASTPAYHFWRNTALSYYYDEHSNELANMPVVNLVFAIPYYIWLSLALFTVLLYRKDYGGLSVFFPILLSIVILVICPVASGRYALPIVYVLPFLLAYLITSSRGTYQAKQ